MEDVLDLYEQPYDPRRPVVCMDESSRKDHEYECNGTRNLFIYCERLNGQCHIDVMQQRITPDAGIKLKRPYPNISDG